MFEEYRNINPDEFMTPYDRYIKYIKDKQKKESSEAKSKRLKRNDQVYQYLNNLWRSFDEALPQNNKDNQIPEIYVLDMATCKISLSWFKKEDKSILDRTTGSSRKINQNDRWCYKSELFVAPIEEDKE